MKKAILLCFLAAGVLGAAAAPAGIVCLPDLPKVPTLLPAQPAAEYFRRVCKSKIEARGILNALNLPAERRPFPDNYLDYVMTGLDGALSVNGKLYALDFGTNPDLRRKAQALSGKRVIIHGHVETRHLPFHPELGSGGAEMRAVEYVVVTSIEDQDEYVRETVEVELQGRFHADYLLGFGERGPVVQVNGTTYLLEFGEFRKKIGSFDGRIVRIRGRLGEMRDHVPPPILEGRPRSFRVLYVSEYSVATETSIKHGKDFEITGPVQLYRHIRFGKGAVGIDVAGHTYWLDFTGKDDLYDLVTRSANDGGMARVIGRLRGSDGAVEVLRVEFIEPEQFYRETTSVEIRGFLQEAPRDPSRPELMIYPPFRTLQVNVNGRVLTLNFPKDRGLFTQAYEMRGRVVTIRGQLHGDTVTVEHIEGMREFDFLVPVPVAK